MSIQDPTETLATLNEIDWAALITSALGDIDAAEALIANPKSAAEAVAHATLAIARIDLAGQVYVIRRDNAEQRRRRGNDIRAVNDAREFVKAWDQREADEAHALAEMRLRAVLDDGGAR